MEFLNLEANHGAVGTDGSEWILEGVAAGNYHFVSRWLPQNKGGNGFTGTCEYLVSLAGLKIAGKDY